MRTLFFTLLGSQSHQRGKYNAPFQQRSYTASKTAIFQKGPLRPSNASSGQIQLCCLLNQQLPSTSSMLAVWSLGPTTPQNMEVEGYGTSDERVVHQERRNLHI